MQAESPVAQRWRLLQSLLNERQRRAFAAAEAKTLGRGGVAQVVAATGLARNTVLAGLEELAGTPEPLTGLRRPLAAGPARRSGGGRKPAAQKDRALLPELLALLDPDGDGEPPLRWTCRSLRALADELCARGHQISHVAVGRLLKAEGYRLLAHESARRSLDRDAQFEHIAARVAAALAAGLPVISVDARKKERADQPKQIEADERLVSLSASGERLHDHVGAGWVDAGVDADTSAFAAQTIRRWWLSMGRMRFPQASELLVVADAGGGDLARLWLLQLGRLARDTALSIHVCHVPPGTRKWNRIEHRLSGAVTLSWPGRPPICHQAIVQLIAGSEPPGTSTPPQRCSGIDAEIPGADRPHRFRIERPGTRYRTRCIPRRLELFDFAALNRSARAIAQRLNPITTKTKAAPRQVRPISRSAVAGRACEWASGRMSETPM